MQKLFSFTLLSFIFLIVCSDAYAVEATQQKVIERIQHARNSTVYVVNTSGWGAPTCPSAIYAYFNQDAGVAEGDGFDELFAIVLAAKYSGGNVAFQGNCNGQNYFEVDYIFAY